MTADTLTKDESIRLMQAEIERLRETLAATERGLAPIFIWMIINVYQLIWIDIRSWWEWRKYRD